MGGKNVVESSMVFRRRERTGLTVLEKGAGTDRALPYLW